MHSQQAHDSAPSENYYFPSETTSISERYMHKLETDMEPDPVLNPPQFTSRAIGTYFKNRWVYLLPSWQYIKSNTKNFNPFPALKEVSWAQWQLILCATMAWTWDAFDFFTVNLNIERLSEELDQSVKSITWAVTLVLMLRSAGAIFFGVLGDRYGTRWTLVGNLILMCAIQIGVSFIKTYQQFLGVRATFGFVMGGIYGSAAATALNDCPQKPRGFISGFVQQGYAFGYLLAVVFNRAIADNTEKYSWRAVYWFAAGVSAILAAWRAYLPETREFQEKLEERRQNKINGVQGRSFAKKAGDALKTYWLVAIYLILLMAGFNFMSHGTQDLYPTYLSNQLHFSRDANTVTMCVANIGAIVGGLIIGHFSSFIGRRLSIVICCIGGGALVYPWGFVHGTAVNAAVFFMQFFVQGAFGVVPAHLTELAHPDFKVVLVGLAYQLGNLASSASSTIESQLGEQFPLPGGIYDYGRVMAIFVGCVFGYLLLVTLIGPENSRAVRAMENDAHKKNVNDEVYRNTEKGSVEFIEQA